jgi:DNA polymerase-4
MITRAGSSAVAAELVLGALRDHPDEREITLLAISVSNLAKEPGLQLELPLGLGDDRHRPGTDAAAAAWAAERSVDEIRERFGRDVIGYAAVHLDQGRRVPDEFRELAEHDLGQASPPASGSSSRRRRG